MLTARTNDGRVRPVHAGDRHHAGRMAPDAAGVRPRPRALGRQRPAVPGPQRRDAPQRRPQPADQPRLRQGLQRGQVGRRAAQHHAHAGSDRRGDLLARPRLRAVEPRVPHARRRPTICPSPTAHGCWPSPTWPPPTRRSAAGTTNTTRTPGARSPPSARPTPTATRPPPPTPPGRRCSTPPPRSPPGAPPLVTPPFPENPSGHNCATGAIVTTLQLLLRAPTTSASPRTSNESGTTRPFTRLSDALQENINARVWAGIHFRTADLQGVKLGTHRRPLRPPPLLPASSPPPPRLTHPTPGSARPRSTPSQATAPATSDTARRRSASGRSDARDGSVDAGGHPNERGRARQLPQPHARNPDVRP